MHQTRAQVSKKIPIERKGTKYVAKSLMDVQNSVPLVIAIRDMLKLARTAKEVRQMIKDKLLKINGREAKDYRDSIRLFGILEAGKTYILTLTPQGKFFLKETKSKERPCKVIDKKIVKKNKVQLNFHDGSNLLSEDKKIQTQDTLYLDSTGKIKKHLTFSKGEECMITRGKLLGTKGKVESFKNGKVTLKLKDSEVILDEKGVMLI
jgi:small subunit ribosomal protein S4e